MDKTVKAKLNNCKKKITDRPLPRLVGTGYVVVFTKTRRWLVVLCWTPYAGKPLAL